MRRERGEKTNIDIVREAFASGVPRNQIEGLTRDQISDTITGLRSRGEPTYAPRPRPTRPEHIQRRPGLRRSAITEEETVLPIASDLVLPALVARGANPAEITAVTTDLKDLTADDDEKKSIKFVRELFAKAVLGEDLAIWNLLRALYKTQERSMPPNFFDRLRLEAFLRARLAHERRRDIKPLREYLDLGGKIDSVWFSTHLGQDEDFVTVSLFTALNNQGRDKHGFYRADEHGRWYQPVGSGEDGGFIVDNPVEVKKRAEIRERT